MLTAEARKNQRRAFRTKRLEYLASKPRCWCRRVGVVQQGSFEPGTLDDVQVWACRRHRGPDDYLYPADYDTSPEPCMCDFYRTCEGSGILYCRGCGGDNCVCICGGETECMGCADCEQERDYWEDDEGACLP